MPIFVVVYLHTAIQTAIFTHVYIWSHVQILPLLGTSPWLVSRDKSLTQPFPPRLATSPIFWLRVWMSTTPALRRQLPPNEQSGYSRCHLFNGENQTLLSATKTKTNLPGIIPVVFLPGGIQLHYFYYRPRGRGGIIGPCILPISLHQYNSDPVHIKPTCAETSSSQARRWQEGRTTQVLKKNVKGTGLWNDTR